MIWDFLPFSWGRESLVLVMLRGTSVGVVTSEPFGW